MGKILTYEEIKKNEHVLYSESYEVRFWIMDFDGFWKQNTKLYFGKTKAEHEYVRKRWLNDSKNKQVNLISITYQ